MATPITNENIDQFAITPANINDMAEVIASLNEYDFIYIVTYKAGAYSLSRIELNVFKTAVGAGLSADDIVNNLTSTATNKALSAAQGKVLKELIDGRMFSSEIYTALKNNIDALWGKVNELIGDLASLAFNGTKTSQLTSNDKTAWPSQQGGGETPSSSPILTYPANNSTVNVGTNTGNGITKSITIQGSNLTQALSVSVSGAGFSVSPTPISAANANNGTTITVTYNGTDTNATGTLTISSSEVSATVNLTASYQQQGGGDEPTPSGYVDNGLVLHLDCQNAGNQANHWIDLVDGVDFELSNVTTDNDGGMVFTSANSSYGVAEGAALGIPFSQGTIEVVVKDLSFKNKATPFKCSEVEVNGIAFGGWNFGGIKGWCMACSSTAATSSRLIWNNSLNDGDLITGYFGMTQATAVVNGVELPTHTNENGNGTYTLTNGVFTINANESGNIMLGKNTNSGNASTYMDGTILAVRVYNRQLSAAEMIQNYNVDKTKYGLS